MFYPTLPSTTTTFMKQEVASPQLKYRRVPVSAVTKSKTIFFLNYSMLQHASIGTLSRAGTNHTNVMLWMLKIATYKNNFEIADI
jgi:hypothetical protein